MSKRTMSTSGKIITVLIYVLAVALLVGVFVVNSHKKNESTVTTTTAAVGDATTVAVQNEDLPYNAAASDKYADIEPVYTVKEVSIEQDGNDVWSAFVDGRKVTDYTGVAKGEHGWFFVRDGEVDFHYNGIAGNENGNWYVEKGKVNFSFTGTYTVNGNTYRVVEGQVMD